MGYHRFSLLAACLAATAASAQAPQPSPPAAANPATAERRNVSDAQLGLEVQVQLFQQLNVSNLSSIVRFGVATLSGVVSSDADRQRAEQIALETPGVTDVINELRVADASTLALAREAEALAERESANVETLIAERLSSDAALGSRSIFISANDLTNTVTLTGSVSTDEEKQRAGQLASSAYPAGQIRNQLEVRQRL